VCGFIKVVLKSASFHSITLSENAISQHVYLIHNIGELFMSLRRKEKWVIGVAGIGMFLSTLDSGIMNVALPSLQRQFHSPLTSISWTISGYLLALSSTIIIFGKLSDRYGRLRLFKLGLWVFALSSISCGFSLNTGQLILFRGLQGLGAAMLQVTAIALITTLVAKTNRGRALGVLSTIMAMGPIVGPTVSGLLLSTTGWRWIFWINLPLCLLGLWGCSNLKDRSKLSQTPLNLMANLLFSLALFCNILMLTFWHSMKIKAPHLLSFLGALTFASLTLFWILQRCATYPLLPLSVFRHLNFSVALLSTLGFGAATAVVLIIPPLLLENLGKLSPWQVGLVSFCMPIGAVASARFSGRSIQRWGAYRLMSAGLLIMMLALAGLASIQYRMGPLFFALLLFVYGCGCGLFQPPSIAVMTGAVAASEQGMVSAMNRMTHNFGNALGVAVSASFLKLPSGVAVTTDLEQEIFYSWLFALILNGFSLIWSFKLKNSSIEKDF
jgi:MFS family permease